jgi:hypothetical protein
MVIGRHVQRHAEQVTRGMRRALHVGIEPLHAQVGFLEHVVDQVVGAQAAAQTAAEVLVVVEEQP